MIEEVKEAVARAEDAWAAPQDTGACNKYKFKASVNTNSNRVRDIFMTFWLWYSVREKFSISTLQKYEIPWGSLDDELVAKWKQIIAKVKDL